MIFTGTGNILVGGRIECPNLIVEEGGQLTIDGTVHTGTTVSNGIVDGAGTLWARWDTSEWIGGTILDQYHDPAGPLTTRYYGDRPVDASWVQIMSGSIVVTSPQFYLSFKD